MSEQRDNGWRRLLKTAALAGGAATVAVAAGGAVADSVEQDKPKGPEQPAGKQGYRVTPHVETYYRLARQ